MARQQKNVSSGAILLGVLVAFLIAPATSSSCWAGDAQGDVNQHQLVVMDPLAAPLSCPCVEGYAQRKYEFLAKYLEQQTGDRFELTFVESLKKFREKQPNLRPDLVIGKDSVVRFDAQRLDVAMKRIAQLTDQKGGTTQYGMFVVRSSDPAQSVGELAGYQIFFGGPECDEKYDAAMAVLKKAGIALPEHPETCTACSDGATRILELGPSAKAATVISSYAAPLLEGCGTIKKGDLRVVGSTAEVPFVSAFVGQHVDASRAKHWQEALLSVGENAELCLQLETLLGFIDESDTKLAPDQQSSEDSVNELQSVPKQVGDATDSDKHGGVSSNRSANNVWPGWRGAAGDGHCAELPAQLGAAPVIIWSELLAMPGLGGIAADEQYVVLGDRDITDQHDVFRCYDALTGVLLWELTYAAPGKLDYGNTPRATPRIDGERVYLAGAFGHIHAVELATGTEIWQHDLWSEFGEPEDRPWGYCASPLLVEDCLIVHPGTRDAAMVALDAKTGELRWTTSGPAPRYGSFISRRVGSTWQIIGHDDGGLAAWDYRDGKQLWRVELPNADDFNVSTPLNLGPYLLVASENNGTRLYQFRGDGTLSSEPIAQNGELAPDMSSPVVVGERLFCAWNELYCLDIQNQLRTIWTGKDSAIRSYAPLIADDKSLLLVGCGGELLLIDTTTDSFHIKSRLDVLPDKTAELYAHPALVGHRMYLRGESELVCIDLGANGTSDASR